MPAVFVTKRENGLDVETLKDQVRIDPANTFYIEKKVPVYLPIDMCETVGEILLAAHPDDKRIRSLGHQLVNLLEADDEETVD